MLPHWPYRYLPSGKTYGAGRVDGITRGKTWGGDEWAVAQGYQRYLLQVEYANTLLGKLVARLRELRMYDRSLLVIAGDHGCSFRLNDHRRQVSRTNIADKMGVPLFIKAPYQQKGVISDRHVQLIDVMPTMLDMLDIPDPWRMDGTSAIGDAFEKRSQLKLFDGNTIHIVEPAAIDHSDTLKWKFKLFDSGKLPDALFRFGPRKELIGREVDKIGVAGSTSMIVSLDDTDLFSDVDLKSDFIPARISGTIPKLDRPQEPYPAIAINRTLRALTRPTEPRGRFRKFSAMVPETAFRQGRNHVEAFLVSTETTGKAALWRAEGQQFPPPWLKKLGRTETRKGQHYHYNEKGGFSGIGVRGTSFQPGAKIRFDDRESPRTTYADDSFLTAIMPATVYSEVGTIQVTVKNPDGQVSNSLPFVVLPQPENLPALRLEKLSPAKTGKGQGFRFNEEAGFSAIWLSTLL